MSNKVKSKIRTGDSFMDREGGSGDSHQSDHVYSDAALSDHREDANSSGASTPRGDVAPSAFGVFAQLDEKPPVKSFRDSGDESEGKPAIHKFITNKAEQWMGKKGLSWPWKGNEREGGSEAKTARFGWPWLQNDQDSESVQPKSPSHATRPESHLGEGNKPSNNEASGSWSSSMNVNSTSSVSSCGSTSSSAVNKVDLENDCFDYEILWEDLTIGEQIGQGNPYFIFLCQSLCMVLTLYTVSIYVYKCNLDTLMYISYAYCWFSLIVAGSCGTVYHGLWYGSVCS